MVAVVTMVCRRKVLCFWLCRYHSRVPPGSGGLRATPLMSGMLHEQSMVEELMFSIDSSSDPPPEPSSMSPVLIIDGKMVTEGLSEGCLDTPHRGRRS